MRSSYSLKPPVYSLISSRSVVEARDSAKVVDQVRFLARTLVIGPELCDSAPVAGGVISGLFWLCGRLVS
jgi:hypothetical protein